MILSKKESINYIGGASIITSAFLSSITSFVKTIYTIGQNFGSTIKRLISGKTC